MTEAEFVNWQRYAAKRMLPWRRIQLQLAQLTLKLVQVMGGNSEAKLADFLFDPVEDEEESAEEFFRFNPRNKPTEEE